MPTFNLITTWKIPASLETCWFSIIDVKAWPDWWKYVDSVIEVSPGNELGINSIQQYYWSTCLPYHLGFELCVTKIIPYQLIVFQSTGDLRGWGSCQLSKKPHYIQIQFEWHVQINKPWMSTLAYLAQPVFQWNHRRVMQSGEQSLIQRLNSSA